MHRLTVALLIVFLATLVIFAEKAADSPSSTEPLDPCEEPLAWRIGQVDPRFGLPREELEHAVLEAAGIWEAAAGRPLFRPDTAGMPINLVYDDRQESYERRRADAEDLDRLEGAVGAERARLETARSRVAEAEAAHSRLRTRASLQAVQSEVNRLNRAVGRYNAAVGRYNAAARSGGSTVAEGGRVKAGDLSWEARTRNGRVVSIRRTLNIGLVGGYEELVLVLAHELGHALGLDHVHHPDAIMAAAYRHGRTPYPVRLHPADREAFRRQCADR